MSEYGSYAKEPRLGKAADLVELLHLSLKLQLGKRFWAYPLLPLAWPLLLSVFEWIGVVNLGTPTPAMAQNYLIGVPLYFLAIALGMQIISSEIEQRTLEVCYTVPGGAQRIWLAKLGAALLIIIAAEIVMAVYTWLMFSSFPPATLYRALQGAIYCLVLSTWLGALFRNKMTAGMAAVIVLFLTGAATGMGENPTRYSPYFNPLSLAQSMSGQELLYWLLQNHIGYALVCVVIVVLTFSRAERRELLLSDD